MKTRFKKLFLLAIILMTPNLVNAASSCSYSEQAELNDIVANVKANYEVVDVYAGKMYDVDNPNEDGTFPEKEVYVKNFKISILNITDDIYVKVLNDNDNDVKTYRASDANDGVVSFQTSKKYDLVTYTIEVYANKYSCAGEKFREFKITTPMYNYYSQEEACKGISDFYYCQEFIPTETITLNEFKVRMQEYKEKKQKEEQEEQKKNRSFIEKLKEFYKDNTIIVNSIGVAIVVMGVATAVILIKKKRSRVL